jgi:hypothetical protein
MGGGYPMFMGMGSISSPIGWRGLAGMGISGDQGVDGGVIPGHPRPRCHLEEQILLLVLALFSLLLKYLEKRSWYQALIWCPSISS